MKATRWDPATGTCDLLTEHGGDGAIGIQVIDLSAIDDGVVTVSNEIDRGGDALKMHDQHQKQ